MKLIMMGPSGAGKGTHSEILSRKFSIPIVSTGNILREAVKNDTPIGLEARSYMEAGQLVPDDIIIGIVAERLAAPDCANGYILDGVPRTIAQAEAIEAAGIFFDAVLAFDVPDEIILERITGRRTCTKCGRSFHVTANPPKLEGICDGCGGELILRSDDSIDTVKKRLEVFYARTSPLGKFYDDRGVLKKISNQPTIEATSKIVMEALGI